MGNSKVHETLTITGACSADDVAFHRQESRRLRFLMIADNPLVTTWSVAAIVENNFCSDYPRGIANCFWL